MTRHSPSPVDPGAHSAPGVAVGTLDSSSLAGVASHPAPAVSARSPSVGSIPWYLWCYALGLTSAYLGGYVDISWHRSIGRDTFWSPPHLAIQACGVLAGIASGYLIFTTTFGRVAMLRGVSVRIWGLSAPLGAFVAAWGGWAALASAPFDDWWHGAYGLDVIIISPPHMVLSRSRSSAYRLIPVRTAGTWRVSDLRAGEAGRPGPDGRL